MVLEWEPPSPAPSCSTFHTLCQELGHALCAPIGLDGMSTGRVSFLNSLPVLIIEGEGLSWVLICSTPLVCWSFPTWQLAGTSSSEGRMARNDSSDPMSGKGLQINFTSSATWQKTPWLTHKWFSSSQAGVWSCSLPTPTSQGLGDTGEASNASTKVCQPL